MAPKSANHRKNWWLLHPIKPLLQHICLNNRVITQSLTLYFWDFSFVNICQAVSLHCTVSSWANFQAQYQTNCNIVKTLAHISYSILKSCEYWSHAFGLCWADLSILQCGNSKYNTIAKPCQADLKTLKCVFGGSDLYGAVSNCLVLPELRGSLRWRVMLVINFSHAGITCAELYPDCLMHRADGISEIKEARNTK